MKNKKKMIFMNGMIGRFLAENTQTVVSFTIVLISVQGVLASNACMAQILVCVHCMISAVRFIFLSKCKKFICTTFTLITTLDHNFCALNCNSTVN